MASSTLRTITSISLPVVLVSCLLATLGYGFGVTITEDYSTFHQTFEDICALTCVNGNLNVKKCSCSCDEGWAGELCDEEEKLCDITCEHGRIDKSSCECQCREGYSGEFCNITETETTTQAPVCDITSCGDHGDFDVLACQCNCMDGWSGELCEVSRHGIQCKEENYCLNGGKCYHLPDIGERTCQCKPNYMGPRCQYAKPVVRDQDPNSPNCDFCLNGGTCVFFEEIGETVCNCQGLFIGTRCQYKDPHTLATDMQRAEELQTKRILTIIGIFVALLVLTIICIVAWCKARSDASCCISCRRKSSQASEKNEKNESNDNLLGRRYNTAHAQSEGRVSSV